MKKCLSCGESKTLDNFYSDKRLKDGLRTQCKKCMSKKSKEYRDDERKGFKEKRRAYILKNKDKILKNKKRYYIENKTRISLKMSEYEKNRLANDPVFALTKRLRRRMGEALTRIESSNPKKIQDTLGCTAHDFAKHIEKQFLKGMNWENRDKWHLDHIVPISSAKTEEEVYALSHFTNIRPMWASDNIKKGSKRNYLI